MSRAAVRLALGAIQYYRVRIRPGLRTQCHYTPSCSEYARRALLKYGFVGGVIRALKRIRRCVPGSPGGVDEP